MNEGMKSSVGLRGLDSLDVGISKICCCRAVSGAGTASNVSIASVSGVGGVPGDRDVERSDIFTSFITV